MSLGLSTSRLIPSIGWLCRSVANKALTRPAPTPRGKIATPANFLKAIGRESDTKVSFDDWSAFWTSDGDALKRAGVGIRDRRYILWCMEKYRQGLDPQRFAHDAQPKKKIRGRGPAVQNGRRIRSRRLK